VASAIDNLRERWDRITPRERLMVMALGGTALFLIFWWVGTTIIDGLDTIEKKNATSRKALKALHEHRLLKAQGMASDRPKIPIGKTPVELESYLERIAKDVGIEIPGYSPRPEAQVGDYTEVATRFDVRGLTIVEVKDLLERIETGQQGRVVISDLRIKRQFREQEKLDVELVVATYYNKQAEDDEEGEGTGEAGEGEGG
jgi:hypothetical protein